MTLILLGIILLSIPGMNIARENKFHEDYMGKKQTTIINGIFVLLVFMSHAAQYVTISGTYHDIYLDMRMLLKQAVVVTFLLYSGYGMMESIKNKGPNYINRIPKRGLKLLLQYDVAIILFILTNYLMGIKLPLEQNLLAFTSWTGVGNSNWYITTILVMYIVIFIAFKLFKSNKWLALTLVIALTAAYILFSMKIGRPSRNYNTIICLPFGMFFSLVKPKFDKIMKNDLYYLGVIFVTLLIAIVSKVKMFVSVEHYSMWMITFGVFIILFTMKVKINSPLLEWMGKRVFSVYILQRIPMRLLEHFSINDYFFVFISLSFVVTLIMALLFDKYVGYFVNLLFQRKTKKVMNT